MEHDGSECVYGPIPREESCQRDDNIAAYIPHADPQTSDKIAFLGGDAVFRAVAFMDDVPGFKKCYAFTDDDVFELHLVSVPRSA